MGIVLSLVCFIVCCGVLYSIKREECNTTNVVAISGIVLSIYVFLLEICYYE